MTTEEKKQKILEVFSNLLDTMDNDELDVYYNASDTLDKLLNFIGIDN